MHPLCLFIAWILSGAICSHFADKRGRSPFLWFFIGSFFGILSLFILLALPARKPNDLVLQEAALAQIEPRQEENFFLEQLQSKTPTLLWYYLDRDFQQQGPISYAALKKAFLEEKISKETYVWNEEWENWKTLEEVPDFPS
ncbi:MAG: hypothetical protein Tsb0015_04340 [Simkaniaceae bacterium]